MRRRLFLALALQAAFLPPKTARAASGVTRPERGEAAARNIPAAQLVNDLLQVHFLPAARDFEAASLAMRDSFAAQNRRWPSHRPFWIRSMIRWEILNAVSAGPLLERRSARNIDFTPTRPPQIQAQLSKGLAAMDALENLDRIGASALGLPALEWLLYKTSGDAATQRYALLLANHVLAEATALREGFAQLAEAERDETSAWTLYSEWVGQASGSLDQLRGRRMQWPLRDKHPDAWPRATSGQTSAAWAAQWTGLESFLTGPRAKRLASPRLPVPGSLNSLLLARGHVNESALLVGLVDKTYTAVARSGRARPGHINATVQALTRLKAAADNMAIEQLGMALGFTEADGD